MGKKNVNGRGIKNIYYFSFAEVINFLMGEICNRYYWFYFIS
jgi:hypothetical protein